MGKLVLFLAVLSSTAAMAPAADAQNFFCMQQFEAASAACGSSDQQCMLQAELEFLRCLDRLANEDS